MAVLVGLAMLGPFTIDTTFPAFAAMGEEFGASQAAMQQVTSVYLLSFAAMSVVHGPLSDALGRKPVMVGGLAGYVLATIGCALAPSLPALLVCRALQGMCAGAGTIVSRAVARDLFEGAEAHKVMSRIMMLFSIAPAVAPVIGGLLLSWGRWPLIFWAIAAYGLVILLATGRILPETLPPEHRQPFRAKAILASLVEISRHLAFQRLAFATAFTFSAQFLYVVAAPIIVVDLLGKGEQDFWVLFVPMISGLAFGAWLSGRLADIVPPAVLVDRALTGVVLATVTNLALALVAPTLPYAVIGPALMAIGTAVAFPVLQLTMLDLFPQHRGAAASMGTFATLVFNAFLAGAVAALVTDSLVETAVSSLVLSLIGASLWTWHRRALSECGGSVQPTDGSPP